MKLWPWRRITETVAPQGKSAVRGRPGAEQPQLAGSQARTRAIEETCAKVLPLLDTQDLAMAQMALGSARNPRQTVSVLAADVSRRLARRKDGIAALRVVAHASASEDDGGMRAGLGQLSQALEPLGLGETWKLWPHLLDSERCELLSRGPALEVLLHHGGAPPEKSLTPHIFRSAKLAASRGDGPHLLRLVELGLSPRSACLNLAAAGQPQLLRELLERHPDLKSCYIPDLGDGYSECRQLLVEHGARAREAPPPEPTLPPMSELPDHFFRTMLASLLDLYGDAITADVVRSKLEGAEPGCFARALAAACGLRSSEVAEALLDLGVPPDAQEGRALIAAIRAGKPTLIERLLDAGVDPNTSRDPSAIDGDFPPLHEAARRNNLDIVRLLERRGARTRDASLGSAARYSNREDLRRQVEHRARFEDLGRLQAPQRRGWVGARSLIPW